MDANHNRKPDLSITTIVPIIAFGLFILFGGILIANVFGPIVLPVQASAEAQNTDALFHTLLLLGGAIFLLVQGLLLYAAVRFRAQPGDTSDGPPMHGNMTLEIVWTIIPAIIVVFLAVLSYNVWVQNTAVRENENLVNGDVVDVHIVARRFAWSFEYTTPIVLEGDQPTSAAAAGDLPVSQPATVAQDGEGQPPRLKLSSTYLHTYVGQNVHITMSTEDVIHSFWVPEMRVKQDLLPGRITELRFTPILAGEYPIVCTELCGSGHGNMVAIIIVHEDEAAYLANFYEPAVELALNPPEDPVLRGEQILSGGQYPCAGCHQLDTLPGWVGITGPSLEGLADRAGNRVPGQSAVEYITESLRLPNAYIVPGYNPGLMNYFGPTAEPIEGQVPYVHMPLDDLRAVVAFLCTQSDSGENMCDMDTLDEVTARYEP